MIDPRVRRVSVGIRLALVVGWALLIGLSTSARWEARAAEDFAPPAGAARSAVLDRLTRLNQSEQFLFGEQNATLWGMYLDGHLVSTSEWFQATAHAGRFTSDSEAMVGDHPAVLGVTLQMLVFEPVEMHRRAEMAEAIRRQIAQGGLVTMDWHAPSCDANLPASGVLATVLVDGRNVPIHSVEGGTPFYAEEEYTRTVATRAEVPGPLGCLCQIANDLPLTAGPYQGVTGKTWLVAHARYAAQVFREQGLSGLSIIMRPFHEHYGSWFWWGQPYWNCAALLDKPDAISGPEAYKTMVRLFISELRAAQGMDNLLFAYAPNDLLGPGEEERMTAAQKKVSDPEDTARGRLRTRLVRELEDLGLAYVSPAQTGARLRASQTTSARRRDSYVAQRRRYYAEAYAGDDVFDVLGIDLYYPMARPANRADLRHFRLQLRALAEEAHARNKAYALTEVGTLRLPLLQLSNNVAANRPLPLHGKNRVDAALKRLFDVTDRKELLQQYGLGTAGPVALAPRERAKLVPERSEDWFNQQLLVLAKEARVAYALVWQTYSNGPSSDHNDFYFVPYPGHPEARSFERFYAAPATCFLRDGCATGGP